MIHDLSLWAFQFWGLWVWVCLKTYFSNSFKSPFLNASWMKPLLFTSNLFRLTKIKFDFKVPKNQTMNCNFTFVQFMVWVFKSLSLGVLKSGSGRIIIEQKASGDVPEMNKKTWHFPIRVPSSFHFETLNGLKQRLWTKKPVFFG